MTDEDKQELLEYFTGVMQCQYVLARTLHEQGVLDKQHVVDALRFRRAQRESPGTESALFAPLVYLAKALERGDADIPVPPV